MRVIAWGGFVARHVRGVGRQRVRRNGGTQVGGETRVYYGRRIGALLWATRGWQDAPARKPIGQTTHPTTQQPAAIHKWGGGRCRAAFGNTGVAPKPGWTNHSGRGANGGERCVCK